MKKIIWGVFGAVLVAVLTVAGIQALVINSKIVSSAEDILDRFYETRNSLPPLPSPISYQDVMEQLSEGRYDFVENPNWAFNHDGGTFYLSEQSELAIELQLPAKLLAYEDLC